MNETLERLSRRLPSWAQGRQGRLVLAVTALVVVVLVLAVSCLGGAGGRTDVPVVEASADGGIDGVRAPSETTGGTLRVVAGEVDSLDPQRSYKPGVWNLMRLYTRTLVTYSSEPGRTDELVPDLATDLGTPSEDGLSWTFTLREGVRFENGRAITAHDVKYGIERSFAAEVIVGGPTYVVDLLDDRANPYAGPYQDEAPDRLGLASVETPDERTIVFRLRAASAQLPYVLALPSSSPVPAEADTGGDYGIDPVSSGPYAITSVDVATGIQLDRNPEWDPATDAVRTALPDRVVVRTGLSGVERDQALLAGSADVDIAGSGVQAPTTARLEGDGGEELRTRVDDVTSGALRLLAIPTDVAPFGSSACRAAVAAAIDRRAVQEALSVGGQTVRTSRLWTRALGGGPEDPDPAPDLDAARRHLEECGVPDGFATVLAVPDARASVQVAEAVAEQLGAVGIEVEVRPLDAAGFYATDVGNPDSVAASGYGLVLATSTPDFPTPASLLVPLVDGRSIRQVGNTNYARLADQGINELIDRAFAAGAGAREEWLAVAAAAEGTAAYVPLAEARVQLLAGQRLRNGVVMRPYTGYDLATAGVR
ncbi:ABC transporter substrate-binding protein [Blastococcus sp. TML/M2B]|uniref:ABC transporter substrate-binding protein n=1 Tax=unclassified Blastococcus TaxID=2619396 RepID=UPI00190C6F6B|nr:MULTISPECIES: ABC transporter substrate-binding protein [unclassified Blastococcus]MBN1093109.1 ABC transporter substrate-binding protein [Blastococcus sp. TML/M2B]MBN1096769.1 ABC transporter substrate-binding protein [Blastococcus sp. TML/C7B]